jgi:hypothetical protein
MVSVHLDTEGEVDTVEKLDRQTASIRDPDWGGRDSPFPTASAPGQPFKYSRSRIGLAHGALYYPTTVVFVVTEMFLERRASK